MLSAGGAIARGDYRQEAQSGFNWNKFMSLNCQRWRLSEAAAKYEDGRDKDDEGVLI